MKSTISENQKINLKRMSKKYIFLLLASATLGLTSCCPFNVRSDYA